MANTLGLIQCGIIMEKGREMDYKTVLYGKNGDGGVSSHLRESLFEIFSNFIKDFSDEDLKKFLKEVGDDDNFPEFCINWYDQLADYMEEERDIDLDA